MRVLSLILNIVYAAFAFVGGLLLIYMTLYFGLKNNFQVGLALAAGASVASFGLHQFYVLYANSFYRDEKRLSLINSGIVIGEKHFDFSDVAHLRVIRTVTRKTMNFMPAGEDQNAILEITLKTQPSIEKFVAGPQGTIAGPSFGERATQTLLGKAQIIMQRTFASRSEAYRRSLEEAGYFIYDGVRIDADGTVHHSSGAFNIRDPKVRIRGNELLIVDRPAKWLRGEKTRSFNATMDRDVFFILLEQLDGMKLTRPNPHSHKQPSQR